ncbi:MAG: hypothetical protein RLZZ511_3842 [Cyanobacteriota bacterium]|jgi:hypothetical protein
MRTIDLWELGSTGKSGRVHELQLAGIKDCQRVKLHWLFKTNNIEIARSLAKSICIPSIIVMNGESCMGVGFLLGIEPASWKIYGYIP